MTKNETIFLKTDISIEIEIHSGFQPQVSILFIFLRAKQEQKMCKYVWLVWQRDDVRNGAFELFSPWWMMTNTTFCAAIPTESVAFAKSVVAAAHHRKPSLCEHDMHWLSVELRDGVPFSHNFPRAQWMFWPGDAGLSVVTQSTHEETPDVATPETTRATASTPFDFLPEKLDHNQVALLI
jgi:hypothetical protein